MIKFITFIWLISISLVGISQSMLPLVQDTNVNQLGHEISISGVGDYQSTSIGKDITRAFFNGGLIDESMKTTSSSRHDEINRFGIDINSEIEYRNHNINLFKDSLKGLLLKEVYIIFPQLFIPKIYLICASLGMRFLLVHCLFYGYSIYQYGFPENRYGLVE